MKFLILIAFLFSVQFLHGFTEQLGSKVVQQIGTDDTFPGKTFVTYQNGKTIIRDTVEFEQQELTEEANSAVFIKEPNQNTFSKLAETEKVRYAMYALIDFPPLNIAVEKRFLALSAGKTYFLNLTSQDKSSIALNGLLHLSFMCLHKRSKPDEKDSCDRRAEEKLAELLRNISSWHPSDLKKAACQITNYLSTWKPELVENDLEYGDYAYIDQTQKLLKLMESSPEFKNLKDIECEFNGEKYQISNSLHHAKQYLPSLLVKANIGVKPTRKVEAKQPENYQCPIEKEIAYIVESAESLIQPGKSYKNFEIISEPGCSIAMVISKTKENSFKYEKRDPQFRTMGNSVVFEKSDELLEKLYGKDILKNKTVQTILSRYKKTPVQLDKDEKPGPLRTK